MALITKIKTVYSEVVAALGFIPENSANRAQPNGYAGLDSGGKVPAAQLPLASASTTGALSSTDWATFNAKQAALSGAGIVKSTNGTISYLTDNSSNWNTAYNRSLTSATVTGTTTKTLTLNQQSGTNITASWSDLNTDAVTSVFGRTGAVVATEGDYSLTQLSDVNLASPANGQLLQNNGTQWVNWTPNYLTANQVVTLSGDVTGTGATAITATLANTTVTAGTYGNATQVPQITVDSKGRATSAGNVTITPAWSSVTGTPTTISGYGITDGVTLTGTQTLTNKTVTDATFTIQDDADNTKKAQFQASGITTATTRTYTLPNDDGKIVITNSGNIENTLPKFNNDDKLVASNISDNGLLVNIGPYAVFNTGGISVISYISTYNVEILGATLGNFGETNFYGAVSAPTLYSNDALSQSTVIVNPKIPYCVNGTNGYIGTYSGASIQFASDTTAVNFWGLGVGTNGVATDTFSIGRNNTQFFTINNSGAITTQIVSTRANNTGTGLGQIYLNGATGNRIDFNTNGAGAPTFTTRSVGAKIVLYPGVSASASDYALGIASSTLWYGVPLTTDQHQFYAGTTSIARIRSQGIQTRGHIYQGNTAFSAQNAGTTLTISQILNCVIESAPAANITFTLPTGTNTDAGVMSSLETFASFTWSVVNTSTGFTITMAGNTGNTYIGNTTIDANTSATFRTQKTAANTFKTVRI